MIEFDLAHCRRIHDTYQMRISCKNDAKHPAIINPDRRKPSKLFQYRWTDPVCIVIYDEYRIAGRAAIDQELIGDVTQFFWRPSNVVKPDVFEKGDVEVSLIGAGFVDDRKSDLVVEAGNVAVQQRGFS